MTIQCSKYCGLCSTGASRMEKAKYNTHGQAKYHDDGRSTCTRNKFSIYRPYNKSVVHEDN